MDELKTQGLVLSAVNMNDNDKIFTILTRDYGKITAISKGIRSHKHKDFAALQNFCYSEFVLNRKSGLYYVSSANVLNNFFGIRNSVEQVSYATYFTDIVKAVPDDMAFDEEYYNFILNTLFLIGKAEEKCKDGDVPEYLNCLKAVFEMKTACSLGYMPQLTACGICGTEKGVEYFDVLNGTALCKSCKGKTDSANLVKINNVVLKMLIFICMSDYKRVFGFGAGGELLDTVSEISERYIINCIEFYPSSLTYLKKLSINAD